MRQGQASAQMPSVYGVGSLGRRLASSHARCTAGLGVVARECWRAVACVEGCIPVGRAARQRLRHIEQDQLPAPPPDLAKRLWRCQVCPASPPPRRFLLSFRPTRFPLLPALSLSPPPPALSRSLLPPPCPLTLSLALHLHSLPKMLSLVAGRQAQESHTASRQEGAAGRKVSPERRVG